MFEQRINRGNEFLPGNEPMISPETLLADNRSEEADRLRETWDQTRRKGKLTCYFTCGDARILTPSPESSIAIRTIATGGLKEPYYNLLKNRGVEEIVVLDHHDGNTVKPGEKPTGCGGLAAKEQFNGQGKNGIQEGIGDYIEHEVKHSDLIIQTLLTAEEIAMHTNKPVMAATQDHLTERIYPLAVFLQGGLEKLTTIHLNDITGNLYNPSRLYSNGIPVLDDKFLPPNFKQLLETNRKEVAFLQEKYPDLEQKQKIQNPRMVVLSTAIRSMRIRYPVTSQEPGSLFKLNVPRKKKGLHTNIDPEDLRRTLNQAEYPIKHAAENFGDPAKPFSKTDTVFIETGDMELSRNLAEELTRKTWMKKWLSLQGHQVLIAQTQEGISNTIEKFTPANS